MTRRRIATYAALCDYLRALPTRQRHVTLTLDEIGRLVGPLPWSSNSATFWTDSETAKRHWLAAGFDAQRNRLDRSVTFTRRLEDARAASASWTNTALLEVWRMAAPAHSRAGKYVPLVNYLAALDPACVSARLTLAEIEALVGPLPLAGMLQNYWRSSAVARINWLQAGWTPYLEHTTRTVTFTRKSG